MENSNDQSLTLVFTVNQTPEQVFVAINNVRGWWTGKIDGSAEKLGDEFAYRYKDLHFSKQKVTELIPGKKVVWHVLDASLEFAKDKKEWVGTDIVFEILKVGDKTEVRFTHQGLVPQFECYDACFEGWSFYIRGTLPKLIASGKNQV